MRDYGRVHTSFWSSGTIAALSEDGRMLALYLLSSPHTTMLGAFRLPDGYACEDLRWSTERFLDALAETVSKGFANRCETTKWVWVRRYLAWNPPENPNQRKAAMKLAREIPDECAWKAEFSSTYEVTLGETLKPLRNRSQTVSKPFRNQDQDQDQDQESVRIPRVEVPRSRVREASAPRAADAAAHTHSAPRPVDLTGPPKVIAAWCDGYEAATQQPAMLRPGKADQDARLVADWLTRAGAWPSLDALVRLFLAAPEFAGKRQLGMFAANLPQLAAWLTEHGPDVPYGDEDARFRAERARELAKLTAQAAQDAPRTTIGRAEAAQVVRRLETVLRPAGGVP